MARKSKPKLIRNQNIKILDDGSSLPIKDVAIIEKMKQEYIDGFYR